LSFYPKDFHSKFTRKTPLIPPENAQEEPGLPLGSSGHGVGFWVTGLQVFGVRSENTLTSRKSAFGSPGVHHRRIRLLVALPDLAGCGLHGHHGFTIGAPPSPDFSPSRAADHGGSELPGFGSLSPDLSVSLLSLRSLSLSPESLSLDISLSLSLKSLPQSLALTPSISLCSCERKERRRTKEKNKKIRSRKKTKKREREEENYKRRNQLAVQVASFFSFFLFFSTY
jgi:hypothetical protein